MVDHHQNQTVCCLCGDVGFPDKLFRCSACRNRFQHSYCSNYYSEYADPIEICDWCQCEAKSSSPSKKHGSGGRSMNAGKPHHHREEGGSSAEKVAGKAPSPRTATRRYKLLKDVMC